MSYRLARFGVIDLPCARMTGTFGTGPTVDATVQVLGGTFCTYGATDGNLQTPYELTHSCWIVDTEAGAQTTLEDMFGFRGQRHILYRINEADLSYSWCWARCVQVRNPWQWQRKTMNPLDIVFQVQTPWYGYVHGTGWSLDGGETLDPTLVGTFAYNVTINTSPKSIAYVNNGNAISRHVSCRVTAGGAAITALTIAVGSCDIDWSGTLASTKVLQLTQRQGYASITNDGANAYSGLTFGGSHTSGWWFEFAPGSNTVTVTITGGSTNSTFSFDYADGYA